MMEIQNVGSQAVDGGRVEAATSSQAPAIKAKKSAEVEPTPGQVQGAVDNINKSFKESSTNLEFSVDSVSKRSVVKMVDTSTGELISQYPSKTAIAISAAIDQQLKTGALLKEKA